MDLEIHPVGPLSGLGSRSTPARPSSPWTILLEVALSSVLLELLKELEAKDVDL
jgi:hypothetical protein